MPGRVVDPIYVPFAVLTAAGTLPTAPQITTLDVPAGTWESVDLRIPPGHSAQTGIRFTLSGQQVLPWSNAVTWITDDDLKESFEVGVDVDTKLAAVTYNTGAFPHTFYLRVKIRQLPLSTRLPRVALLPNGAL